MDSKETDDRLRYLSKITAKYGYQTVPIETVYRLFQEVVQPHQFGFSQIQTGLYGKEISRDIIQLLKLTALKGASYTVWWGVSLTYMPHGWQTRVRWHRTFKTARFDLFETPVDFPDLSKQRWKDKENFLVDRLHGERYLRKRMHTMWNNLKTPIHNWFSTAQTLSDILEIAREQKHRNWTGPLHNPSPQIVVAFTLARLGKKAEAVKELSDYLAFMDEAPAANQSLFNAIDKIALLA